MHYKGKAVFVILTIGILISMLSLAPSKPELPLENKAC